MTMPLDQLIGIIVPMIRDFIKIIINTGDIYGLKEELERPYNQHFYDFSS